MAAMKFVLLFALLFVSVNSIPRKDLGDGGLVDLAKKIVKFIENLIDTIIPIVIDFINNINTNWDGYKSKIVDFISKIMNEGLDFFKPILEKIAEQSSDEGKKLAGCIEGARDAIIKVPVDFAGSYLECVGSDLIKVVSALGPLVKDLADVQVDAKAAADGINSCEGDDIQGLLCVVQVFTDLLEVAKEIPEKLGNDIAPVLDDIKILISTAEKCAKDSLDPLYKNIAAVLDNIGKCAA